MKAASLGGIMLLAAAAVTAHADGGRELTLLWETDGFKAPECALFDEAGGVIYVSNVNGDPTAKDGNGFISRVSTNGAVIDRKWVTGLDAPKGLAMSNGKLYVTDIDTVVEIDPASGTISNTWQDASAVFLNDAVAGPDGAVFVSDSGTNRIYRLHGGKLEIWLEDAQLDSPNGLLAEPDRLVVGAMGDGRNARPGELLGVRMSDKSIFSLSDGAVGHLDGLQAADGGGYYLSDWVNGKVMHFQNDEVTILLELPMGTADFEFIEATGTIVLPRMMDDKLAGYRVSPR